MKWATLLSIGLLATAATAQERAPAEAFVGYSYLRMSDSGTANLSGGSASLSIPVRHWLDAVADFGGYNGDGNGLKGSALTYLFGPKIIPRRGKVEPFVQVLVGGAHNSADPPPSLGLLGRVRDGAVAGGGQFASSNSFALAAGGGIDLRVGEHFAIRILQAEYLLTTFRDGLSDRQDSTRISAGAVFRF